MSTASSSTATSRIPWHTIVIAAATIALLWLFVRRIEFDKAWHAITQAHLGYLLAATVVTMGTYTLRAIRWLALLRPLGPARLRTAFRTTVIGFTATFLLPGRVGEILRPFILAKQDGLKFTATFATVILERLLDVSTVLVLFAISIQLLTVDIGPQFEAASLAVGASAIGALVLLFVMAGHPERLGRWAGKIEARLPRKAAGVLSHLVQTFAEGLVVMRRPSDLLAAVLWSFPVWISIGIGIWLTSHAFDLTLSFVGAFLVVGYLAVGVSVPTPGGAGGFHYFYLLALTQFFGADPSVAAAAAIILHAISFVPITFLGLFFMWQDGLTLGGLRKMKDEATSAEESER